MHSFALPSRALAPWRFSKKRRTFEVQVDGQLTANELPIAVRAAIDGAGLIQIPLAYVAPELAAGRLVTVLADWARPPVDGFLLYYPSRWQIRPPGAAPVDLTQSLAYGAALRVACFGNANEHADWETAHHMFTYTNALHQMLKRIGTASTDGHVTAVRGLLHGAMALYLTRYLNVPRTSPARRFSYLGR
jgi:hypothetical protein